MIDLKINSKIGKLTCIEFSHFRKAFSYYKFVCDCGNYCTKQYSEVKRKKHAANCGCVAKSKLIDWTSKVGERVGSLELTKFIGIDKNKAARFEYKCNCGNTSQTSYSNFNRIESCGCKNSFKLGEVNFNYTIIKKVTNRIVEVNCSECQQTRNIRIDQFKNKRNSNCICQSHKIESKNSKILKHYKSYKHSIKYRRFKDFDIEYSVFEKLTTSKCSYCGVEAKDTKKGLLGLDRINSNLSYTEDNVTPCCYICNVMKSALSVNEFYSHLYKIISYKKEVDNKDIY